MTVPTVYNEIKLFANLCIKQGILSTEDCQRLSHTLKTDSELLDFAQTILEEGREGQFEQIQALLHQAEEMTREGKIPGSNPFKQSESAPADPSTSARPKIKLPSKKKDSPQPQAIESAAKPSIKAPLPTSPAREGFPQRKWPTLRAF